jgi:abequosyltransferase
MKRLSICMPTFNRADLLRTTLSHLLPQIDPNRVEIIVSDNASTDHTEKVINALKPSAPFLKYIRNSTNIGLDNNVLASIEAAEGDYCWLCSDDDIALPGTVDKILSVLCEHAPLLAYLRHAGYFEDESFEIVTERAGGDKPDVIYTDPIRAIVDLKLSHLSSIVIKREAVLPHFFRVKEYERLGFTRGYSLSIASYALLAQKGTCYLIGKLCLAVRNPYLSNYDPLSTLSDIAQHYQILRRDGFIEKKIEHKLLNHYTFYFSRMILSMKCKNDPYYTKLTGKKMFVYCKNYRNFWFFIFPSLLLPKAILVMPYFIGRFVRRSLIKYFNLSPF